jgi:O-antigen/teichoic acid export membrane protein
MVRLCLPVAALLVALADEITRLVLPAGYHGHIAALFPIIAVSVLAANLTSFVYGSVVHAHKRPWLLIIANGAGSIATIALSLLLIPPMAEAGAAFALLGGSLASLIACIVISHRLTPVPVPWRDIGTSVVISASAGFSAFLASSALPDAPVIFRLAAGGAAGGLVFLALNSVFHPEATMQALTRLRSRLGRISI